MRASGEEPTSTPCDRLLARVNQIMSATSFNHANADPNLVRAGYYTLATSNATVQILWYERTNFNVLDRARRQMEFLGAARRILETQFGATRVHRITARVLGVQCEGYEIELGK